MTNFQRYPRFRSLTLIMLGVVLGLAVRAAHSETFALQPGAQSDTDLSQPKGGRLISLSQMNLPGIDGTTIRYRRPWGRSFIDGCVKTVNQASDKWTLLVCSGDVTYPTAESNLREWELLISELGQKHASDLSLWGVHITGCTPKGTSEELHWTTITPAIEAANKRLIDAWAQNFPGKYLMLAMGNKDIPGMKRIISYAVARAPGRVVVKTNALKPGSDIKAAHIQLLIWSAKVGANIGFEPNQPSNHPKFDGTWTQFVAKQKEIERLAGKPFLYKAIYPGDLAKVGAK